MVMGVGVVCLMISCMIISMESPQLFVAYLLVQALMVVIFVGLLEGIWYSYVLFLVFLGGLLILFVYVGSLASGVKMDYKVSKHFLFFTYVSGFMLLMLNSKSSYFFNSGEYLMLEGSMVSELISNLNYWLYLYIVLYLLLALYNVCWVMKMYYGPLRMFT